MRRLPATIGAAIQRLPESVKDVDDTRRLLNTIGRSRPRWRVREAEPRPFAESETSLEGRLRNVVHGCHGRDALNFSVVVEGSSGWGVTRPRGQLAVRSAGSRHMLVRVMVDTSRYVTAGRFNRPFGMLELRRGNSHVLF